MKSKEFYEFFKPNEIVNANCYNSQLNLIFRPQEIWKILEKPEHTLHICYSETNKSKGLMI